jgi:probable rRNA maturation factor
LALLIVNHSKYTDKKLLSRLAKEAFLYLGEEFEVGVDFVTESLIQGLNLKYRGKDMPTNVLTFSSDEDIRGGDVAICEAVVKKEAELLGYAETELISLYFVHGILHLAGFDHEITKDRDKMEKAEVLILEKAGVHIERK